MNLGRPECVGNDWLEAELLRAGERRWEMKDHLLAMGVQRGFLAELFGAGDVGLMRVVEHGGRWRPVEEGERGPPRMILAVRDAQHRLRDLVAVSSVDPDTWSLRTGDGPILGENVLELAEHAVGREAFAAALPMRLDADEARVLADLRTVRVFARPIDLLIGDGQGICVLEWRPAALAVLRMLGPKVTLVADDRVAAARLAELLRCGGLPEVRAAGTRERRAA